MKKSKQEGHRHSDNTASVERREQNKNTKLKTRKLLVVQVV